MVLYLGQQLLKMRQRIPNFIYLCCDIFYVFYLSVSLTQAVLEQSRHTHTLCCERNSLNENSPCIYRNVSTKQFLTCLIITRNSRSMKYESLKPFCPNSSKHKASRFLLQPQLYKLSTPTAY